MKTERNGKGWMNSEVKSWTGWRSSAITQHQLVFNKGAQQNDNLNISYSLGLQYQVNLRVDNGWNDSFGPVSCHEYEHWVNDTPAKLDSCSSGSKTTTK